MYSVYSRLFSVYTLMAFNVSRERPNNYILLICIFDLKYILFKRILHRVCVCVCVCVVCSVCMV